MANTQLPVILEEFSDIPEEHEMKFNSTLRKIKQIQMGILKKDGKTWCCMCGELVKYNAELPFPHVDTCPNTAGRTPDLRPFEINRCVVCYENGIRVCMWMSKQGLMDFTTEKINQFFQYNDDMYCLGFIAPGKHLKCPMWRMH